MGESFRSYDRFDQADLARRATPDLTRQRTERGRKKASELRAKAGPCTQDSVRRGFLDIAHAYDQLANDAEVRKLNAD